MHMSIKSGPGIVALDAQAVSESVTPRDAGHGRRTWDDRHLVPRLDAPRGCAAAHGHPALRVRGRIGWRRRGPGAVATVPRLGEEPGRREYRAAAEGVLAAFAADRRCSAGSSPLPEFTRRA